MCIPYAETLEVDGEGPDEVFEGYPARWAASALAAPAEAEPQFLSVSVTEASTITLVAEAEQISALAAAVPENLLEVDETHWSVVRVGEGSLGFESIGGVEVWSCDEL